MGCAEARPKGETHPLDGKLFKMKVVYDEGNGPMDKFVSFQTLTLAYRCTYDEEDAVPIKFFKVEGKPNTYTLQQ